MSATVDPTGSHNQQTGTATVRGTMTCSGVVDFALIDLDLRQRVGRGEVTGRGIVGILCDGTPWRAAGMAARHHYGSFPAGKRLIMDLAT